MARSTKRTTSYCGGTGAYLCQDKSNHPSRTKFVNFPLVIIAFSSHFHAYEFVFRHHTCSEVHVCSHSNFVDHDVLSVYQPCIHPELILYHNIFWLKFWTRHYSSFDFMIVIDRKNLYNNPIVNIPKICDQLWENGPFGTFVCSVWLTECLK